MISSINIQLVLFPHRYANQTGIFESLNANGLATAAEANLFRTLDVPTGKPLFDGFWEDMWKVTFGMPIVSQEEEKTLSSASCRDGVLHLGRDFMPPYGNDEYLGDGASNVEAVEKSGESRRKVGDKTIIWLSVLMSQHKNLNGDAAALLTTPALREIQSFFNTADLSNVPELQNLAKYHLGLNLGQDPQGMFDTGSIPAAMETFATIPEGAPHIGVLGDIHTYGCRLGYHLADTVYNVPYMTPKCVEQVGDARFPRFISGGTRMHSIVEPVKKVLKEMQWSQFAFVSARDRATGKYAHYHGILPAFMETVNSNPDEGKKNEGPDDENEFLFDVITRRNGGQNEKFLPFLEDDALMFYHNSAEDDAKKRVDTANETIQALQGLEATVIVTLANTPEVMLLKCVAFLSHRTWWQSSRWVTVGEQLLARDLRDVEQLPCSVAEMSISSEGHMNLPASPLYEEEDRTLDIPGLRVQYVRERMARSAVHCHGWLKFQTWMNLKDDASLDMIEVHEARWLGPPYYKKRDATDKSHLRKVYGIQVNQLDEMPMFPNLNCEPLFIGTVYDLVFSYLKALNDWVGQGNKLENRLATTSGGRVQDMNAKKEIFEILKQQQSFQGVSGKYRYEAGIISSPADITYREEIISGQSTKISSPTPNTFGVARAPLLQIRQWYAVPQNGMKDPTLKGTVVEDGSTSTRSYAIEWARSASSGYPKHAFVDWPWRAPVETTSGIRSSSGSSRKSKRELLVQNEELQDAELIRTLLSKEVHEQPKDMRQEKNGQKQTTAELRNESLPFNMGDSHVKRIAEKRHGILVISSLSDIISASRLDKNATLPEYQHQEPEISALTRRLEDETLKACPWLRHTGLDYVVRCADGHVCNIQHDSKCCVERGSQRVQCPPNYPKMCENPVCQEANQDEYCCRNDDRCETRLEYGGLRKCPYTTTTTSTVTSGFSFSSTTSTSTTRTSSTTSGFSSTSMSTPGFSSTPRSSTTTRTSSTISGFSSTSSTTSSSTSGFSSISSTTTRTSSSTSGFSSTSSTTTGTSSFSSTSSTTTRTTSSISGLSTTSTAQFPEQITQHPADATTQYPGQTFFPQMTERVYDTTTPFSGQTFPPQTAIGSTTQFSGQTFPPVLTLQPDDTTTQYPGQTEPAFPQQVTQDPDEATTQYPGQTNLPQITISVGEATTAFAGQTFPPQVTGEATTPFPGQTTPVFPQQITGSPNEATTQYPGQTTPVFPEQIPSNETDATTPYAGQTTPVFPEQITESADDTTTAYPGQTPPMFPEQLNPNPAGLTTQFPGQTFGPQITNSADYVTTQFAGQTFPVQAFSDATTPFPGQTTPVFPQQVVHDPAWETTTAYPGQTTPVFPQQLTENLSDTTTPYAGQTTPVFPQQPTDSPGDATTEYSGQTTPMFLQQVEVSRTTQYPGQTYFPQVGDDTTTAFVGQTFPPQQTLFPGDITTQYPGQTWPPGLLPTTTTSTSGFSSTSTFTTSGYSTTSSTLFNPFAQIFEPIEPPGGGQPEQQIEGGTFPPPPTTTTTTTTEYVYLNWYADRRFYFPTEFGDDGRPKINFDASPEEQASFVWDPAPDLENDDDDGENLGAKKNTTVVKPPSIERVN